MTCRCGGLCLWSPGCRHKMVPVAWKVFDPWVQGFCWSPVRARGNFFPLVKATSFWGAGMLAAASNEQGLMWVLSVLKKPRGSWLEGLALALKVSLSATFEVRKEFFPRPAWHRQRSFCL